MKSIVCMPLESMMQILCTINYILNGEKLELKDITIYESEQENLKRILQQQRSDHAFVHFLSVGKAQLHKHTTYAQEQQILSLVREATRLRFGSGSHPRRPF